MSQKGNWYCLKLSANENNIFLKQWCFCTLKAQHAHDSEGITQLWSQQRYAQFILSKSKMMLLRSSHYTNISHHTHI